jgi:hypothetical protein
MLPKSLVLTARPVPSSVYRFQLQKPLRSIQIALSLCGGGYSPIAFRPRRPKHRPRIAYFIGMITRQDLSLGHVIP